MLQVILHLPLRQTGKLRQLPGGAKRPGDQLRESLAVGQIRTGHEAHPSRLATAEPDQTTRDVVGEITTWLPGIFCSSPARMALIDFCTSAMVRVPSNSRNRSM